MSTALSLALEAFGADVDLLAEGAGVSNNVIKAVDVGISTAEEAAEGHETAIALAAAAIGVVTVAALAPELLVAAGVAVVGEEAVLAAAALVNEAIAASAPALFTVTSGEAIVATATGVLGGAVLNGAITSIVAGGLEAMSAILLSPQSVSLNTVTIGQLNVSNKTAAVFSDGGNLVIGGNAVVTTFNTGSAPGTINLSAPVGGRYTGTLAGVSCRLRPGR
jgi:hypothetical protein